MGWGREKANGDFNVGDKIGFLLASVASRGVNLSSRNELGCQNTG